MDVVARFMEIAEGASQRCAVHTGERDWSFSELKTWVRKFAAVFATIETPRVLVAYEQGANAYAAMLGTMLAGGCYAPVNVTSPRDKLVRIAQLFKPHFIVGAGAIVDGLADILSAAHRISLQQVQEANEAVGLGVRHPQAYVIFTSGSTGAPKGVVISHAALAHYIDWVVSSGLFQPGDRASQYTNIGFDVSVLDIVGALCCGATLVPFVSRGDRLMPAEAIKRHLVTVWTSVPSVISLMQRARQATPENLGSVQRFFFVGEPLLEVHVAALFAACPQAEIWNAYGPTETTVTMTLLKLTADTYRSAIRNSVALGEPIAGMDMHVLGGENLDSGELVIVGPQLAEGYWEDPEQTMRVFRDIDVSGVRKRAYFSGDWVRRYEGHVYFESRVDHQVKIDGLRLELDEVAAAIRAMGWPDVAVFKIDGHITAVLEIPLDLKPSEINHLRLSLQAKLEPRAVPSRIFAVAEFPRNQNDKIDLAALKTLAAARLARSC
jgi:D-alanine--poly(phosphoribitol) ligase subunit 1